MDHLMVLAREPDTDELVVLLPNASMGAAPRENGDILVKIKDVDTGVPIMAAFDPDSFMDIVKNFQAALGSRIVAVDDEEVRRFGATHGDEPSGDDRAG